MDRRFPEPTADIGDRSQVLLGYLDYFRATVADKLDGVEHEDLRRALVPSGWSMLELVKHLVFMERRWVVWGFLAETVDEPWGGSSSRTHWPKRADTVAGSRTEAQRRPWNGSCCTCSRSTRATPGISTWRANFSTERSASSSRPGGAG